MTLESTQPSKSDKAASSSDGWLGNRQEHTIAGALIGATWDAFGAPQTDEARRQRAASSDEYAHLAADVVASIPQVKVLAAAGLRGAMLFDPNGGLWDNTVALGMNAVGGAAINKVMKSALPEGTVGRLMLAPSKAPLFNEAAGHYLAGFGFSVARSTFDTRTWHDEHGNLSAIGGLKNIAVSSASGALVNIPAGMVGLRVARQFGAAAADAVLPRMMMGTASGSAAGAVFGFSDGLIQTQSLSGAFTGLKEGAAVGAITGGAVSALPPGRFSPTSRRVFESDSASTNSINAQADTTPLVAKSSNFEPSKPGKEIIAPQVSKAVEKPLRSEPIDGFPLIGDGAFDASKVQRLIVDHSDNLTFKTGPIRITEVDSSLPEPKKVEYTRLRLPFDAPTSFQTESDFYKALRPEMTRALRYDLGGNRSLTITQEYADALAPIRELRRTRPTAAFDHQLWHAALPEDVVSAMTRVPDLGRIGNVTIVNEPSINDLRQKFVTEKRPTDLEGATTMASISTESGDLTLFAPKFFQVEETLKHEQVHRTQEGIKANDEHQRLSFFSNNEAPIDTYEVARKIDKKSEASTYGYTQSVESEAEMEAKVFLHRSLETFFEGAERAPVRMASIARRLAKTINNAEPENRSMDAQEILARTKYIERYVTPRAIDEVITAIESGQNPDAGPLLARLVSEPNARAQKILEQELTQGEKRTRLAAEGLARMDWRGNLPKLTTALENASPVGERAMLLDAIINSQPTVAEQQALALAIAKQPTESGRLAQYRFHDGDWLASPAAVELLSAPPGNKNPTPVMRVRNVLKEPKIQWNEEGTNHEAISLQGEHQELAAEMMRFYGDKSDIPKLKSIAESEQDRSHITKLGKKALESAAILHSPNPQEQLKFLIDLTAPNSKLQQAALEVLSDSRTKYPGDWTALPEAEAVSQAVSVLTNSYMDASIVSKGLHGMPSPAKRMNWFDYVVPKIENRDYIGSVRSDISLRELANSLMDIPELVGRAQALIGRIKPGDPSKPESVSLY